MLDTITGGSSGRADELPGSLSCPGHRICITNMKGTQPHVMHSVCCTHAAITARCARPDTCRAAWPCASSGLSKPEPCLALHKLPLQCSLQSGFPAPVAWPRPTCAAAAAQCAATRLRRRPGAAPLQRRRRLRRHGLLRRSESPTAQTGSCPPSEPAREASVTPCRLHGRHPQALLPGRMPEMRDLEQFLGGQAQQTSRQAPKNISHPLNSTWMDKGFLHRCAAASRAHSPWPGRTALTPRPRPAPGGSANLHVGSEPGALPLRQQASKEYVANIQSQLRYTVAEESAPGTSTPSWRASSCCRRPGFELQLAAYTRVTAAVLWLDRHAARSARARSRSVCIPRRSGCNSSVRACSRVRATRPM